MKEKTQQYNEQYINRYKIFFVRGEYSKLCPEKKDFIVKGREKKQKRIILGSIKQLHAKYLETDRSFKILTATFWRFKPFWVVLPKQSDRETCACIKHANIHLIVEKLYYEKLVNSKHSDELFMDLICDDRNMACMLGNCMTCKNRKLKFKTENVRVLDKIQIFLQWDSKAEDKIIKEQKNNHKSERKVTGWQLLELPNKNLIE